MTGNQLPPYSKKKGYSNDCHPKWNHWQFHWPLKHMTIHVHVNPCVGFTGLRKDNVTINVTPLKIPQCFFFLLQQINKVSLWNLFQAHFLNAIMLHSSGLVPWVLLSKQGRGGEDKPQQQMHKNICKMCFACSQKPLGECFARSS